MLRNRLPFATSGTILKSLSALAMAAVLGSSASGQTNSGSSLLGDFSNPPNYISVIYDLQNHSYGAAFLNKDGTIWGKQIGTPTPPTKVDFSYTGTAKAAIPQFLNVSDNQLQLISKDVFNSQSLQDLINLWQSGSNSIDASYGETWKLFPQLFRESASSDFLNVGIMGDYKQLHGDPGAFSGRAQGEVEITTTLWRKSGVKVSKMAGDAKFNDADAWRLDIRTKDEAAAVMRQVLRQSQFQATDDEIKAAISQESFAKDSPHQEGISARLLNAIKALRTSKADLKVDRSTLPSEFIAEDKVLPYKTLVAAQPSTTEMKQLTDRFVSENAWFAPIAAKANGDATKGFQLLAASAISANEPLNLKLAVAQQADSNDSGATLKLYLHGFSWIDSGPGAKLDGFAEGGLLLNFGKASGNVVPGISLTALTGNAPSSVTIGKPYFRLQAVIPF